MEKVAKIVLIACIVLIVINVVTMGIYIKSYANNQEELNSTDSGIGVISYNNKYKVYEGVKKGNEVKKLLELASEKNRELYKQANTIKYCVCIRTNDESILDNFSTNSEIRKGLIGKRDYGVRYPTDIQEVSGYIVNSHRYNIWFSYNDLGYIGEIHIDKY